MDKNLKHKIVTFVVIFFFCLLLPGGINMPSQVQTTSIVSAIGIDKEQNELEISAQIIIPEPSSSFAPKYLVASAKGQSLSVAIENLELKVGQKIGLSHCFVIVLGDDACNDNIANTLDYLMRSSIMGNNSALIHTNGKAKDILSSSSELSEADVNNLQNIAKYDQEHNSSTSTNMIEFFNDYLSCCPYSVMSSIDSNKSNSQNQDGQNQSQNQGESGSPSGTQSSSSSSSVVLKNDGKAAIFKKGKKIDILEKEQIEKFGWLDQKAKKGFFCIENFSNEDLTDCTVNFRLENKNAKFTPKISNNKPILCIDLTIELKIESIHDSSGEIQTVHKNYFTNSFVNAIKQKISQDINDSLSLSKQKNFDISSYYLIFNSKLNKEWKTYLNTLENSDDYLKELEITTNINVHNKL